LRAVQHRNFFNVFYTTYLKLDLLETKDIYFRQVWQKKV